MLRLLRQLFDSLPEGASSATPEREHTLELATAVLMIEVVRADGRLEPTEADAVMAELRARFALSEEELADLFELAHHHSEHSHDLFTFTQRLNQALDEPQRIRVFETLWAMAYADGRADDHEAHLLRRLADLLHIRHGDAIGAKLRAERMR
jgi:uncharacterized tellurite resistance protein B-like protein